jgi:polyhydroxyalkanoate synthase
MRGKNTRPNGNLSVASQALSIDPAFQAIYRAQFAMSDILRRAQGDVIAAFGLGAAECFYDVIASGPHWRLRHYGDHDGSCPLLVVAAPIKQAYIWDLAPAVSAVRYCLQQGLDVYLIEWNPASRRSGNPGLDDCASAIDDCVQTIANRLAGAKPFLIGHSLGGTLAAIFAASAPESVHSLVLLCAPLCFQSGESRFRDALVSILPLTLAESDPFPGSLLSHTSALASPDAFIWSRLMDAALSLSDHQAMDIHARVERWALDEVPLPGKLVHQMVEWLYRENRFCNGALRIHDRSIGPSNVSVPALAVVNTADEIAPLASVKPFIDRMAAEDAQIVEYRGEVGVALQHLGILIGREAHAKVWPQIVSWLHSRHPQPGRVETAYGEIVKT